MSVAGQGRRQGLLAATAELMSRSFDLDKHKGDAHAEGEESVWPRNGRDEMKREFEEIRNSVLRVRMQTCCRSCQREILVHG
eukprot:762556-Hanusia_phi.AAC.10